MPSDENLNENLSEDQAGTGSDDLSIGQTEPKNPNDQIIQEIMQEKGKGIPRVPEKISESDAAVDQSNKIDDSMNKPPPNNSTNQRPSFSDRIKSIKNFTQSGAMIAMGNYFGGLAKAIKSGALKPKNIKKNWKEAGIAFAVVIIIAFVISSIFFIGIQNMLPGTKGGTTFAQADVNYNSLNRIRQISEGKQGDEALLKEIKVNGTSGLIEELNNLQTAAEKSGAMSGTELEDFKVQVSEVIAGLNSVSAMPSQTDEEQAKALEALKPLAEKINQIVTTFENKMVGQPSSAGLYNLPASSYYIRREPYQSQGRQYGRLGLIMAITNTAKTFHDQYPNYLLRIGDLSFASGGTMPTLTTGSTSHRQWTHKCGYDADITIAHTKNPNSADGVMLVGSKNYNREMVKFLADTFFQNGIKIILYQYPYNDYSRFNTTVDGHKDHFHIRMSSSWDHYPGCLKQ